MWTYVRARLLAWLGYPLADVTRLREYADAQYEHLCHAQAQLRDTEANARRQIAALRQVTGEVCQGLSAAVRCGECQFCLRERLTRMGLELRQVRDELVAARTLAAGAPESTEAAAPSRAELAAVTVGAQHAQLLELFLGARTGAVTQASIDGTGPIRVDSTGSVTYYARNGITVRAAYVSQIATRPQVMSAALERALERVQVGETAPYIYSVGDAMREVRADGIVIDRLSNGNLAVLIPPDMSNARAIQRTQDLFEAEGFGMANRHMPAFHRDGYLEVRSRVSADLESRTPPRALSAAFLLASDIEAATPIGIRFADALRTGGEITAIHAGNTSGRDVLYATSRESIRGPGTAPAQGTFQPFSETQERALRVHLAESAVLYCQHVTEAFLWSRRMSVEPMRRATVAQGMVAVTRRGEVMITSRTGEPITVPPQQPLRPAAVAAGVDPTASVITMLADGAREMHPNGLVVDRMRSGEVAVLIPPTMSAEDGLGHVRATLASPLYGAAVQRMPCFHQDGYLEFHSAGPVAQENDTTPMLPHTLRDDLVREWCAAHVRVTWADERATGDEPVRALGQRRLTLQGAAE